MALQLLYTLNLFLLVKYKWFAFHTQNIQNRCCKNFAVYILHHFFGLVYFPLWNLLSDYYFMNNSYPRYLTYNCISKFLNKTCQQPVQAGKVTTHYLQLPHHGYFNFITCKNLGKNLCKIQCVNDKFKFIFSNLCNWKYIFLFKDRISILLCFVKEDKFSGEKARESEPELIVKAVNLT